uniref:Pyrin domain-containing protein n=1 Tax=Echeneis naucrates TaxID=173247 RepID=A0A665TT57_ECHNA
MAHTTIPMAIADELGGLNQDEYERFCFALLDRRGEIRVRRRDVEKKSTLELTDLLVSVFTEAGARDVTLELLRKINCNQSAKTLGECGSYFISLSTFLSFFFFFFFFLDKWPQ